MKTRSVVYCIHIALLSVLRVSLCAASNLYEPQKYIKQKYWVKYSTLH